VARLALGVDFAAIEFAALLLVADDLVSRPDLGESVLRLGLLALVRVVFLGQPILFRRRSPIWRFRGFHRDRA